MHQINRIGTPLLGQQTRAREPALAYRAHGNTQSFELGRQRTRGVGETIDDGCEATIEATRDLPQLALRAAHRELTDHQSDSQH
jgi:hypothetical protein